MTAYLIHSLPLLMSAVQIFTGDQMAVVAHLVGLEQIGYETELGMNHNVSILSGSNVILKSITATDVLWIFLYLYIVAFAIGDEK